MSLIKIKLVIFFIIVNLSALFSQNYKVYSFDEFQPLLNQQNEKVYVINFWATWCKPCVKEMPSFNQLYEKYQNKNVEIILVSLDFGNNVNARLFAFSKAQNIKSKIVILDDPDSNSWIDKVSSNWSGAIPATLIYNNKSRKFYEKPFTFSELEEELIKFL